MKLLLAVLFIFSSSLMARELADLQKEHRLKLHEAKKIWDKAAEECRGKFPQWTDSSHKNYDEHFKCKETIEDEKRALREKQKTELCSEFKLCPKK
jgi:hypothetical protein